MNEDFVSFDLAKKLEEKGFTCEYPFAMYDKYGQFCPLYSSDEYYFGIDDFDKRDYIAPTISQVLKWLREEKKIYVMIDRSFSVKNSWHYVICNNDDFEHLIQQESIPNRTWEQAALAGIEDILDNVI